MPLFVSNCRCTWVIIFFFLLQASTTISVLIIYIPLYYQQYNLTSTLQNSVILIVINVFCYYFWFLVFLTYRHMKNENRTLLLVLDEEIKFSNDERISQKLSYLSSSLPGYRNFIS